MIDEAFIFSCRYGHLELAKWFLTIKPTIDISARNEYVFIRTCRNGHLDVAKWLLAIKPTINISAEDEYAFRTSCANGRLEICKWLLSVKPTINISVDNESAFIWSCCNGHLELAKWLYSINNNPDKYTLTIDNNKIIYWNIKRIYPFQQLPEGKTIEDCPICYDQQSTLVTNCGHMFCESCIDKYKKSMCPICRHNSVTFTRFV